MSTETDLAIIADYYFSKRKRFFDLGVSIVAFTLLFPLFFIISVCILLTSGLPIFFTQPRTGKDHLPFKMIKFRTMYVNAHQDQKKFQKKNQAPFPTFKIHDDPRFVGIGKFLSKTGLDELPQLINILRGEMSIVGPRPLPVEEAQNLPSHWQIRHKVRPGVISLWALSLQRHKSLQSWWKLERETLQKGGVFFDFFICSLASSVPLRMIPSKLKKHPIEQ